MEFHCNILGPDKANQFSTPLGLIRYAEKDWGLPLEKEAPSKGGGICTHMTVTAGSLEGYCVC